MSAANRVNIPAICRIPGRGTAFLISPGLLLTSTHVVGSKHEAAKLTAIFFEGSKKAPVEVKLLPGQTYFAASYPDYLDYCIVACETKGIYNVAPVKIPLVRSEWAPVREGDTLLLVQHPTDDENPAHVHEEVKRFEEVLRRRDDIYFLKAAGLTRSAGCPAFNDQAELVGLQSQLRFEGEGYVNKVVAIVTIVKHLFANAQVSKIEQTAVFADVWDTWYVPNDTTRIVSIMANFKQKDIVRQAAERLCEHTNRRDLLEGVVSCGGTNVILTSMHQFGDDEALSVLSLRALWNISFGDEDNRSQIVKSNGPALILEKMQQFPQNEDIAQFGIVVLFNLTLSKNVGVSVWARQAIPVVLAAMKTFENTEVLQKFGAGFFVNVTTQDSSICEQCLSSDVLAHMVHLGQTRQSNVFVVEHVVALMANLSYFPSERKVGNALLASMISPIIQSMLKFPTNNSVLVNGNRALWGFGNDPLLRIIILQHPQWGKVMDLSLGALVASTNTF